ncbi:hypothetical protein VTN02DRAFT_3756 [Thermoascus thermophilus]
MLGLGAYESSSEDETEPRVSQSNLKSAEKKHEEISEISQHDGSTVTEAKQCQPPTSDAVDASSPVIGPLKPQKAASPPREHPLSGQSSPFSASRSLIHDLTLPPIPNLDIPPSPPGSPNPALNNKFEHFLSLKKQGVHFNEKLTKSSSLKNPSLLTKMRWHAGIDDQAQYATSIPSELWDVSALPTWGFKEELLKSQQELRRKTEERRAAGQRESIDFVPAQIPAGSSRGGTPSSGKLKPSAAERVIAGLSRDQTKSPADSDSGKGGTAERRARIGEPGPKRSHSKSPPSRRKQSRSR